MAQTQQPTGKPKQEEERGPTQRVVLKRELVLVLPPGVATDALIEANKALGAKGAPKETEAWVEIGTFEGASKDKAIEAHTGPANRPDTKLGTFKAPTASAWAGGARFKAPPKPLAEKEAID